jgi:uncharacterized protein
MKITSRALSTGLLLGTMLNGLFLQSALAQNSFLDLLSVGDTDAARDMINRRTDVNETQSDGTSALHWAIYYDDEELVRQLIRREADVTVRNDYGATPLSQAAIMGNPVVIDYLLSAGADANELNADGQTPIMILARSSHVEAAKLLLDAGADVNVVEEWRGQTALMWAAAQNQPEMVKLLLENGADPDAQSTLNNWERQVTAESRMKILPMGGYTPLIYAAREGCALCIQYLIDAGADVNKVDPEAVSPLLIATLNAFWDSAKILLENGANPNKWDYYGRSPLYAAVDYNTLPHGGRADRLSSDLTSNLEMIELLLQEGANPNLQLKLFPLYRALGADRGADRLLTTGATPLFRAARGGDSPAMALLLEYGALVNLPNQDNVTPLLAASGFRATNIDTRGRFRTEAQAYAAMKLLLDTGEAEINAQENSGQTAMHGAATQGWNSIIELLAEHGADLKIEDANGSVPLDYAMGRGGRFGRGAGADVNLETAALLEKLSLEQR